MSFYIKVLSLLFLSFTVLATDQDPPFADPEIQYSDSVELPFLDPEFEHMQGHFETILWPEATRIWAEAMWLEEVLKEDVFEDEDSKRRILEAYEHMQCMLFGMGLDPVKHHHLNVTVQEDVGVTDEETGYVEASGYVMVVDLSKRTMTVKHNGKVERVFTGIESSRVGVGSGYGSLRTPVGEFTVTKEAEHRYGPVLRLSGYQGISRGILIHQDNTRDSGSNGCLHLRNLREMEELFAMIPAGAGLIIKQ